MGTKREYEIRPRKDYVRKERSHKDLNPEVVQWIERGKLREALIGEGEYCLFNPKTNWIGDHDVLLVLQETLLWSKLRHKISEVSREFESVVLELCDKNVLKAFDILLCYFIVAKSTKVRLNFEISRIASKMTQSIKKFDQSCYSPGDLHAIRSIAKNLPKYNKSFAELARVAIARVGDPESEKKGRKKANGLKA